MDNYINLVKLCVGVERVEDLEFWQTKRRTDDPAHVLRHVTRMWPKRETELLNGGSLYWVFKGVILARQRVVRLDEVIGEDGVRRCGIVLDPDIIRTAAAPRRPFQGWRYLTQDDAPPDLRGNIKTEDSLPPDLSAALADIGVR